MFKKNNNRKAEVHTKLSEND